MPFSRFIGNEIGIGAGRLEEWKGAPHPSSPSSFPPSVQNAPIERQVRKSYLAYYKE